VEKRTGSAMEDMWDCLKPKKVVAEPARASSTRTRSARTDATLMILRRKINHIILIIIPHKKADSIVRLVEGARGRDNERNHAK
jgi:hypothetical protein